MSRGPSVVTSAPIAVMSAAAVGSAPIPSFGCSLPNTRAATTGARHRNPMGFPAPCISRAKVSTAGSTRASAPALAWSQSTRVAP